MEANRLNPLPHVLLADRAWHILDMPLNSRAHMLIGAIAPDAWRLMEGTGFRRLHFRSKTKKGQRLGDFLSLYLQPAFAQPNDQLQGYWTGYLSHTIADTVWRRMLKTEYPDMWNEISSCEGDERLEALVQYQVSCIRADRQLATRFEREIIELRWLLKSTSPVYDVAPLEITALCQWLQLVSTSQLPADEPQINSQIVIPTDFVERVIEVALDEFTSIYRHQKLLTKQANQDWTPFEDSVIPL